MQKEAAELSKRFESWQSAEEKVDLFAAEDRGRQCRRELTATASSVVGTLGEALAFEEDNATARTLLADYYWDRFLAAEKRSDPDDTAYFGKLVSQYHDGKYSRELEGDGSLSLTSDPAGAEVWLYDLLEESLVVVEKNERCLGTTPLSSTPLSMGSYLVILKKESYQDVRYPVYISRNREWTGEVKLRTDEEIGEGFLYIPAGPFIRGGDAEALTTLPRSEPTLGNYVVAKHPVTMGEYLEFLNDLAQQRGPRRCQGHAPRGGQHDEPQTSYLAGGWFRPTERCPEVDPEGD